MLSCQAEILTNTVHIPLILSNITLYQTLLYAYGKICITSLWQMAASGGDAISRVPYYLIGNLCSQTFMSAKWGWRYIGGWLYILADFITDSIKKVCIWRFYLTLQQLRVYVWLFSVTVPQEQLFCLWQSTSVVMQPTAQMISHHLHAGIMG